MNRILIIGGTGLLGIPVALKLKESGYIVRILARNVDKARKLFPDEIEIMNGNIYYSGSLKHAMKNCQGVHINLSGEEELIGVRKIVRAAQRSDIERITYISGTSVAQENTWAPVINRKYYAEEAIRESGIDYTIFCPTWFMEVIPKYIRDRKAVVFGKQPDLYHFIASDDYARMVATSYGTDRAINKRFIIHGPEGILFKDAVKKYTEVKHPDISKVINMPYWLATIISIIKQRPEMKAISDWMKAFEKAGELGNPSEADEILGAPEITLEKWLNRE